MTTLCKKINIPIAEMPLDFFVPGVLPNLIESVISAGRFLFL